MIWGIAIYTPMGYTKGMRILVLFLLAFSSTALAHPVAFKGSFAIDSMNNSNIQNNILSYSTTSTSSLGLHHIYFPENNAHYILPHAAFLLKRWNQKESQANIYAWFGGGTSLENKQVDFRSLLGFQADYETRSFYTMARSQGVFDELSNELFWLQYRIGIAPYLANANELHTFLVLETMYSPDFNREIMITPLLRMFYKNILWETGVSLTGEWTFNFMVHL